MRIVIIADVMDTGLGGMKTYADNLVRCIPEVDTENEYFIINHKRSDRDRNVQFVSVTYTKYPGKFFIRKFYQVPKKIRSLNPDVVMETTHMGPFFLPKKIRRVTVIHDLSTFIYPEHYTWINRMAERLLLPGIIKRSSHLITVSESTKRDIQEFFRVPDERISVIHLGVEEIFKPTMNTDVLEKYGIQQPYFLHVGTIQPRKNIELLVDTYIQFRDQSKDIVHLVLVGKEGWKSENLLTKIRDSRYRQDIIITGHVLKEELPVFYSMCELFVFPSHYEGFGLPLLEAIACGARCIAADNSSLREVGGADIYYLGGESGLLLLDVLSIIIPEVFKSERLTKPMRYDWLITTRNTLKVLNNSLI
ncbi:MAG: glycosyltransferase family 1 protein [Cyclobacteriaceae bacterium]